MRPLLQFAQMNATRLLAGAVFSSLLLASIASAAEPGAPKTPGLAIGQKAPAFTLRDQTDRDISLHSLLKKGPVALVFHRSSDW